MMAFRKITKILQTKMYIELLLMSWLVGTVQAFCPAGCSCDESIPSVRCVGTGLDMVPILLNPGIRRLDMAHNMISSLVEALSFYARLEYLDFSHNQLSLLESSHFDEQIRLRELKLSHNNVSVIKTDAFKGLYGLHLLDLSHNSLTELSPAVLANIPALKVLLLAHNKLHLLQPRTFSGMKDLHVLDLCDNYFRRVPSEALTDLVGLEALQLCRNRLSILTSGDFPVPRLKALSLENNNIVRIDPSSFHQLQYLKKLNLNSNLLEKVPTIAFASLLSLEFLYLSRNNFTVIETRAFKGLSNLLYMEISRCPLLSSIGPYSLRDCVKLQNLTLSHNPFLSNIPQELLSSLPRLRNLDLRANSFKTLSEMSLPWGSLQHLDMRENSLMCNCSLQWLATVLTSPNSSLSAVDVQCKAPENLRGVYISRLSPHQLRCVDQLQVVVAVTVVSASTLLLLALSVLLCRYKRRQNSEKLGRGWPSGALAPWTPDDEHSVATRHIMADEYFYHTYASVRKVPVTEV